MGRCGSRTSMEGGWNEGGKGISIADVMTAGAHGVPREVTEGVIDGLNYPNHEAIDFIIAIKQIFSYLPGWDSNAFELPLHGHESFRKVTNRSRMKRGLQFYDDLFDECLKQGNGTCGDAFAF